MLSVQDVRDLVSNYVSGDIAAADFANSFAPVLKVALKSRDKAVKDLALAIHAQISHHFNGLAPEQEFRSNLETIAGLPKQGVFSVSYKAVKLKVERQLVTSNPGKSEYSFSQNFALPVPTP